MVGKETFKEKSCCCKTHCNTLNGIYEHSLHKTPLQKKKNGTPCLKFAAEDLGKPVTCWKNVRQNKPELLTSLHIPINIMPKVKFVSGNVMVWAVLQHIVLAEFI